MRVRQWFEMTQMTSGNVDFYLWLQIIIPIENECGIWKKDAHLFKIWESFRNCVTFCHAFVLGAVYLSVIYFRYLLFSFASVRRTTCPQYFRHVL